MNLTDLEKDFMQAICEQDSMYLEHIEGYMRVIKDNQVSGVVASLIKKGLVKQWVDDEFKMSVIDITEEGMKYSIFETDQYKQDVKDFHEKAQR